MNVKIVYLVAACAFLCIACANATCFTKLGCGDGESEKSYNDQDYWVNVNATNDCVMCVCAVVKRYTVSCVSVDDAEKQSAVKKNGLLNKLLNGKSRDNEDFGIRDVQVELPESEAKKIECGPDPTAVLDPETGKHYYPNLKYVHYYYTDKESYCCTNSEEFTEVDPTCEVKYNDVCRGRVVTKDDHTKLCQQPYQVNPR